MCAIHAGHGTHTIALKFIQLNSDLFLQYWPSHNNNTSSFNSLYCLVYTISITTQLVPHTRSYNRRKTFPTS